MRVLIMLGIVALCAPLIAAPDGRETGGKSSRFALRATLEAQQPAIESSRFRLSGQLTRQLAPMPAQQPYGYSIRAHFAPEGSCTPDLIFAHGFQVSSTAMTE